MSFDSQGGSSAQPETLVATYGQEYGTLASTTREGYTFGGWYTGENGTGKQVLPSTEVTITKDHRLYAKWIFTPYIGDAGGYVFYDKGRYSEGWRYLEAAPAYWSGQKADPLCVFGYHHLDGINTVVGTETRVGSGEANTKSLVSTIGHVAYTGIGDTITAQYAAKICADYRGGGYDDWFLPSRDELDLLCQNLHSHHLGGFFDVGYYWSSSEGSRHYAWSKHFYTGCNYHNYYYCKFCFFRVRPIRAF